MHRIDGATAAATLPAPGAVVGTPGYFTDGDPDTLTPPTTMSFDWANAVQEEIAHVIETAGDTLDKSSNTQLLAALSTLFVLAGSGSGVIVGTSQVSIPLAGGFILKFGSELGSHSEGSISPVFDDAFPTKCWVVVAVGMNTSAANGKDVWAQGVWKSTTGFTAYFQWTGTGSGTNSIDGLDWIAIGN